MSDFFPVQAPAQNAPATVQTGFIAPEYPDDPMQTQARVEASRAVAEVQSSLIIAKKFPRNEQRAFEKIKVACGRASLANVAVYSYARGGTNITGASIRLMEAIKVLWGNIDSGWREIERSEEKALIQAYAWDKEGNVREERTFEVPLIRTTKKGSYRLTDPRDIYELEANMASRRVRACLQAVIPGDIVDEAIRMCLATQSANVDMSAQTISAMVDAFARIGVTREMLEKRLQRSLTSIQPGQVVGLRNIYASLRDGVGRVSDFFDVDLANTEAAPQPSVPQVTAEPAPEAAPKVKKPRAKKEETPAPAPEPQQAAPAPAPAAPVPEISAETIAQPEVEAPDMTPVQMPAPAFVPEVM